MKPGAVLVLLVSLLTACGGETSATPDGGSSDGPEYVLGTMIFNTDGTTSSYVSVLPSLEPQTLDMGQAREFLDLADVWVNDGFVYVAEASSVSITKFSVENGALVEQGKVSFTNYGATEMGFWRVSFVSATKAYFLVGTERYVVWNPSTMEISGSFVVPPLGDKEGLTPYASYSDRAAELRDGKLYQPFYWTDDSFFTQDAESKILVIDTATDQVVNTLSAPCPGLDYGTQDEAGNLYFSSWVFAAGGAAAISQPDTCVVKIPAGSDTPEKLFTFKDVTSGHQGAAFRYLGNGKALLSVLYPENASDPEDAPAVTYADNWRFWTYDLASGTASLLSTFDWNDGGQYSFAIDGKNYLLVSKTDYSATAVYDLGDGSAPAKLFDTPGWSVRLMRVH